MGSSAASESFSYQWVIENPLSSNSVRSRPKANDFKDMTKRPTRGIPTARWAYHGKDGALLGYVLRFDGPDGIKQGPLLFCPV